MKHVVLLSVFFMTMSIACQEVKRKEGRGTRRLASASHRRSVEKMHSEGPFTDDDTLQKLQEILEVFRCSTIDLAAILMVTIPEDKVVLISELSSAATEMKKLSPRIAQLVLPPAENGDDTLDAVENVLETFRKSIHCLASVLMTSIAQEEEKLCMLISNTNKDLLAVAPTIRGLSHKNCGSTEDT